MALSVPSVSWFSLLVFSVDLQHSREEKKKKFKDTINIPINITVNINVNITVYITVYITPLIYITVHNRALHSLSRSLPYEFVEHEIHR